MTSLGDRVRIAREAKSWSQVELGRRAQMKQTGISNIELGNRARPRKIHELGKALGKNPEWLLFGTGSENIGGALPDATDDGHADAADIVQSPAALLTALANLIEPLDANTRQHAAMLLTDWVHDPTTKTKAAAALAALLHPDDKSKPDLPPCCTSIPACNEP